MCLPDICPSCGRCSTCGRTPNGGYLQRPTPYRWPQTNPPWTITPNPLVNPTSGSISASQQQQIYNQKNAPSCEHASR
jgi:hypothetical protein